MDRPETHQPVPIPDQYDADIVSNASKAARKIGVEHGMGMGLRPLDKHLELIPNPILETGDFDQLNVHQTTESKTDNWCDDCTNCTTGVVAAPEACVNITVRTRIDSRLADQSISVVIPTFRRLDGLALAVRSVFAQTGNAGWDIDLIIVDNDPDHSARDVIAELNGEVPEGIQIVSLHEPRPGVSNARNAAMAAVKTSLVAFLDDDQSVAPDWLDKLIKTHGSYPAAVTFGPVKAALGEVEKHRPYFERFFSRTPRHDEGYIEETYGCGNSMIDLDLVPPMDPLFDPRANDSGGEDDLLFAAISQSGGRFAWSAEAVVNEHVPESRTQLRYTLARAFSFGQGPCTLARRHSPPKTLSLIMWMLIGAGQFVVYGMIAAIQYLFRSKDYVFTLDRAVKGLGKLFWFHNIDFYGNAARH